MSVAIFKRFAVVVGALLLASPTLLMAQAGSLDPTFGTRGIVTTPGSGTGCGAVVNCAVAIQSDGKIVVAGAGTQGNGAPEIAVARYNTNGSLDSSFGSGGIVRTSAGNSGPAFGIAVQSDGKIVVGAPGNLDLLEVRYNTDGSLDTGFGTGGTAEVEAAGLVIGLVTGGIAVQPDGKIVVAEGGVLIRLLANGQLDSTFGAGGAAGLVSGAGTLALLTSGKILVSSSFAFSTGGATRYSSSGRLDTLFGVDGQTPSLGQAAAIMALSNGKFVEVGTLASGTPPLRGAPPQGFLLVRYDTNGTIDTAFGTRGAVVTTFPGNGYSAAAAVAVQSNGDIVAAGVTQATNPVLGRGPSAFALARYTANGQLDASFGTGGLVTTAFGMNGGDSAAVSALAIQSDGKIVAVGSDVPATFGGPNNGFVLARYLAQ
jgi:uncharacterized delta-60 repeat protein